MTLTIRNALAADAAIVSDLIQKLIAELAPGEDIDPQLYDDTTVQCLALPTVTGVLAFEGDQPIGVLMLNACAAVYAGGLFGEISELYVVPDQRSRGVANALLSAGAEMGRARGWKRLEVGAPLQPAWRKTLEFYLRENFEETGPRLRMLL